MKWFILLLAVSISFSIAEAQPCATGTISANQTICSGSTPNPLTLSGFEMGGHIQWQSSVNNIDFTGLAPGDTLATYQPAPLSSIRYYRVELSEGISGTGCATAFSGSVAINVQTPPTAPTGFTGAVTAICNGATASLQAIGGSEGSGADYQWGSGNVIGIDLLETTDDEIWNTPPLTSTTTFWVRRIASGTSSCTNTTAGVSQVVTVRPALAVSISSIGELCQLPGQEIEITNQTLGQPEVHISWGSFSGQSGSVNFSTSVQVTLDLTQASGNSNFNITGYEFSDAPLCTNLNVISQIFGVVARPAISSVLESDLTPTDNLLCQGYGPVEMNVSTPTSVNWQGNYFINTNLVEESITNIPYDLQVETAGTHDFVVDSLWYATGPNCGHDPADYNMASVYSRSVTIKPTPPAVEVIDGAPSILQFCNYATPLIVDSVSTINDLNLWVVADPAYTVEWKDEADNSSQDLNDIPLGNGIQYFPVHELNGCQSMLDDQSASFLIDLLPLPDLSQSDLFFPGEICSGEPFDIYFDPGVNISNFSILDYSFTAPLSSTSISDTLSFPNIQGQDFSISNSGDFAANWTANILAQNKNVSEINPVICWAEAIPIEIVVNPNATLDPLTTNFEACQNGPNFMIDPGWNGIGLVDWDEPLGIPAPFSIIDSSKVIEVDMSSGAVLPGVYPIRISGGYPDSDCTVDTSFTVSIYASPAITTQVLDVDGTICHNEYTNIQVVSPAIGVDYQWECTGCETKTGNGESFLPHWFNPSPTEGTWSDLTGSYSITAIDTSTNERCSTSATSSVEIIADYASCPEGIDFFMPNGLSLVDEPALYFQWYTVLDDTLFTEIAGAIDQTYFPSDEIAGCDPTKTIVASSLYPDRCWSTTINCFETFGLRECDGPKARLFTSDFNLYPNPLSGNAVVLENIDPDLEGRYSIELFDIAGKSQFSDLVHIQSFRNTVELPRLPPGIYLFRISSGTYAQSIKLIIN